MIALDTIAITYTVTVAGTKLFRMAIILIILLMAIYITSTMATAMIMVR